MRVVRSDLRTVGTMVRLLSIGSPIDGAALSGEIRDRLVEECDYRCEAENQRLFAALLSAIDGATAPRVIAERSSRRVLTNELSGTQPIAELTAHTTPASQAARDRAGQIIFRACFELLFRHSIFNADPSSRQLPDRPGWPGHVPRLRLHPAVRTSDDRHVEADGARSPRRRPHRVRGRVPHARLCRQGAPLRLGYQWEAMRFLHQPLLDPGFRYNAEYVRRSFSIVMFDNPNRMRVGIPPERLFLNREQWGLNAVLAQLGAAGPWRAIIEELLTAPIEPA